MIFGGSASTFGHFCRESVGQRKSFVLVQRGTEYTLRISATSSYTFAIKMEKFPSLDEAKIDIFKENLNSVFYLSIANVLKAFCSNPHEESELKVCHAFYNYLIIWFFTLALKLPSLDRHTGLKCQFLQLTDSMGMDTAVARFVHFVLYKLQSRIIF